jgi:ribosomal protein L7Ae-like RNA K-turn-binding protein
LNSKIIALLGFASKAGKLSYGMNDAKISLEKGKAKLVIVASDVSQKSLKEIKFFCSNKDVSVITLNDISIEAVSNAVGRKCGIISVNDDGFSNAIRGGYANDQ